MIILEKISLHFFLIFITSFFSLMIVNLIFEKKKNYKKVYNNDYDYGYDYGYDSNDENDDDLQMENIIRDNELIDYDIITNTEIRKLNWKENV